MLGWRRGPTAASTDACADGLDNDCDGSVDSADPDCSGSLADYADCAGDDAADDSPGRSGSLCARSSAPLSGGQAPALLALLVLFGWRRRVGSNEALGEGT